MFLHLGPFQGITDVWYRNTFQQYFPGIDKYYTPFFGGIHSLNSRHFRSDELNPNLNDGAVLVPQLLTNSREELERFALQCHRLGYTEINLNMGCPWPQVTNKKRGCGLMPHPAMVARMLSGLNNLPLKVSVKCRLGMHDPHEIKNLLPIFAEAGISELILHARTGVQLYKGTANAELFGEVFSSCPINCIYNGDVFDAADERRLSAILPGLAGLMLGRGLLADPFLGADIKGLAVGMDKSQRAEMVKRFVESLTEHRLRTQRHGKSIPGPMKELWWYLSHSFDEPLAVWRIIRKSTTLEEFTQNQSVVFKEFAWEGSGMARRNA
ncbi:MAG TPA: tRNA-dihydrouridine synthase family protein [Bacteroidales bacterium]|nr:tRNA-dihydrouridine synthase family protein [Bacteroidales bacterium]